MSHFKHIVNKLLSADRVHTGVSLVSHKTNNCAVVISETMCCISCENAFLRWVVLEIYGFFLSVQR